MKKITLLISTLVLVVGGFAQNRVAQPIQPKELSPVYIQKSNEILNTASKTPTGHIRCLTAESEKLKSELDVNYQTEAAFENWITQKILELKSNPNYGNKASRNLPVVVHVLYGNSSQNVSFAQVQSQITALNEDYSATNSDFNPPAAFTSVSGSMDIQFCLAQIDPNGNPTDGVDRVSIAASTVTDTDVETNYGLNNMWDPTKYLNIFVANFGNSGLLGKAVFPTGSGLSGLGGGSAPTYDGVMINYTAFGTTGTAQAPFNKGRSATHEIGHWLGLRHIGGDASGGCGNDFVADTPPQKGGTNGNGFGQNYGCPSYPFTASGECSGTTAEMTMNYMDYTDDPCMYLFTLGQKLRMDAVLLNSPQRKELLTSNVCSTASIVANFTANTTAINVGQTVTFTDASTSSATLNSWSWSFAGGTPSTFNGQTPPAITYNAQGQYNVTLTVGDNASGSDTKTKVQYITVNAAGTSVCDTLTNYIGTASLYGSGTFGWISGHNDYDDRSKVDVFAAVPAGYQLTGTEMWFGKADDGTGSGTITVTVWDNSGTSGAPGSIVYSQVEPISSLNIYPTPTQFTFSTPVTVTGPYYVGIQLSANTGNAQQDSVALITNADTETSPGTAWEQWSDNTWHEFSETPASWGYNLSHAIFVQMCNNLATGEKEILGQLNNVLVYPNPSVGTLNVALTEKANATVLVLNVLGEVIASQTKNTQLFTFDINNHPNGVYFVRITTGNKVTTQKVLLTK